MTILDKEIKNIWTQNILFETFSDGQVVLFRGSLNLKMDVKRLLGEAVFEDRELFVNSEIF